MQRCLESLSAAMGQRAAASTKSTELHGKLADAALQLVNVISQRSSVAPQPQVTQSDIQQLQLKMQQMQEQMQMLAQAIQRALPAATPLAPPQQLQPIAHHSSHANNSTYNVSDARTLTFNPYPNALT